MCAPMMVMMALSAGVSALGAAAQGAAQKSAAETQAAQYRAQAEMQNRQSVLEQTSGQYQQRRKMEQLDSLSAKQRTMVGASGFSMAGSPTDVVIDTQREGMLDIAAIKFNTDLKSQNLNYGVGVSQMNARSADNAADMAQTTGIINTIAPFISLGANDKFMTKLGGAF